LKRIGGKYGGVVGERSPLEGDEVVGSGFPDPDVTEHLICVGAEVEVGGVGARHTVALPLFVGRRRCRLVEVKRPSRGCWQLPFATILAFLLGALVPCADVFQYSSRDPSKV